VFEYVVGRGEHAGYCVATERFVLALHPGLQSAISAIWPLLESDDTHLEEVFGRLIERGVSQAPDFAIAEILDPAERAISVVVHGRATAQLVDDPGTSVSGQGLSTWRESVWTGVRGFMLGVGDDRSGVERLPITGGIVRADWIRWSADAPVLRDARAVREPEAEPSATRADSPTGHAPPKRPRIRRPAADAPVDEGEPVAFLGDILSRPGIRLGDGSVVHADFPLVVGRSPTVSLTESGAPTVPVVVASPGRTISSSHLRIEAAGRAVLLKDLGARNGSLVQKPRSRPFVLVGGAEALVPAGTTIDLGDGVVLEIVLE